MPVTKEEILSEIRKYVSANDGEIPGERTFETSTRIKSWSWKGRFWARWTDAVREAGFDPNQLQQKIPEHELIQKLAALVVELDRFPTRDEMNVHSRNPNVIGFPIWETFRKRFGGMPQIAAALLDFADETKNERLSEICNERLQREESKPAPVPDRRTPATDAFGFVYLKYSPSLRLYKIGKANDPKKRGVGISLLLPHDLVAKHEIKTDCPYLLEKYWELRFKAKKKQGEWYDLTSADIETFRSRREFLFREYFP
jgi:hypothetical protein